MAAQLKMNLSTLLEAAHYLEMQEKEQKEQQLKAAEAIANHHNSHYRNVQQAPSSATIATNQNSNSNKRPHNQSNQTTVLITEVKPATILHSSLMATEKVKIDQPEQQPQVSSSTNLMQPGQPVQQPRRFLNSFDIINNPLGLLDDSSVSSVGDGGTNHKRKNPPMAFRAGTREVHNKLEKHRRAHLKECFDVLKKQLPAAPDEKKTSNLSILHSALRCIQTLKRRERELEHEMERLARDKIAAQQRLAALKKDISSKYDNIDFSKILPDVLPHTPIVIATNNSDDVEIKMEPIVGNVTSDNRNGAEMALQQQRVPIPLLPNNSKTQLSIATTTQMTLGGATIKTEMAQPVQTTALSVMPVGYPAGLVLQKVALVSKGLTDLTPLVSTHFITTPQQLNGKVVPLVNAQYVVKPVVVVSRPS